MCTNQPSFSQAIQHRRSVYCIGRDITLTDDELEAILTHSVKFGPSPYNSQGGRAVLLLHEHHEKLWEIVLSTYQSALPSEVFAKMEPKMKSFIPGCGTILFFENQDAVRDLQAKFPKAKERFPLWSLQASGMLQYSVWVSLSAKGLGASLQHYNLIESKVRQEWNLPVSWNLLSQMPFGSITQQPDAKSFLPLEERVKVFA